MTDTGDNDESIGIGREVITGESRTNELAFNTGVSESAAESARTFLEETEFSEESVFYTPIRTDSCERYRIRTASWDPTRVDYRYCRELRPPDESCEANRQVTVGILIRLPVTFSRRISASGSSGRAPCSDSDTVYDLIEGNATVSGRNTISGESSTKGDNTGPREEP